MHYGECAYDETQDEICELLEIAPEPLAPLRPEDARGARVGRPTPEQPGAWSGPYEAGAVWAVLEPIGRKPGSVRANGRAIDVAHPGCYPLVEHERHSVGVLELEVGEGVACHAVQFTAGVVG